MVPRFRFPIRLLGSALLLAAATGAGAAPVTATTNATANAVIAKPISVLRQADLDFGTIGVAAAGTVVIDPVSGSTSKTGGVSILSLGAHPATFVTTGSRNSVVLIRIPSAAVTLTRVGGTETMTVSNWTLDGPTNRKYPATSAFSFNVGATLNVAAGQADGDYAGTFSVTVQYP